jgi:HSP20 family molecular chaperone IbpA
MRYRHLRYRYTMLVRSTPGWPLGDVWPSDRPRPLTRVGWRPDADTYETESTIEVLVELAGLDEDDFEVQLFEDVLVVEGDRRLPSCAEGAVYHAAGIRQGPFQVEVVLPAAVDAERIEARYERGLLRVTLPKRAGGG